MIGGSNPKFLKHDKKVPYNIRLPQRLIDKYNSYAELTGNTTTNIINNILDDFISDKVVMNDYLENTGGVSVKIPYVIYQKSRFIANDSKSIKPLEYDLLHYTNLDKYQYIVDEKDILPKENYDDSYDKDYYDIYSENYFAELFEVKKIPNNLDISNGDSYVANKSTLQFNEDAIHSGIELFVYNIIETIFADADLNFTNIDSFDNCLYCLYFEVDENNDVSVFLMDYMKAINLLSASGNDDYKDLIIACATELKDVDNVVNSYYDNLINGSEEYEFKDDKYDTLNVKLFKECKAECNKLVDIIANGYNSNNIIRFGKWKH